MSEDELTCPDHPDRIKEWDGTALVCVGCILNAPVVKSEGTE